MARTKQNEEVVLDKVYLGEFTEVNDSITINRYSNGFMIEISGRDSDDEWINRKVIVNGFDELVLLLNEYSQTKLN